MLVGRVLELKQKRPISKELIVCYRYCFLLATDSIVADVLSFIGQDFRLETAVDLLYLTRKYDMQGKYRPLL